MKTEAAISLTLAWDLGKPFEDADLPILHAFLNAVEGMMRRPAAGLRVRGPVALLHAALDARAAGPAAVEAPGSFLARRAELVRAAIAECGGNQTAAARRLGLDPRTVVRYLRSGSAASQHRPETPAMESPH